VIADSGLGCFLKLTETEGSYASHPLGGCRMASDPGLGVVDHRCEVFGNEGLFCIDSSAIPTSLGVNPSLTISAVCERAAEQLVLRAADFNLPPPAPNHQFNPPPEIIGSAANKQQELLFSSVSTSAHGRRRKRRRKKKKRQTR
jgi:hypothetical protein